MNELIPINMNDPERITVSARDLHEFLEVETRFNDWFHRMCEYGFAENHDFRFYSKMSNTSGGRPAQDAQITIDMAKELCMLQRNEKGKQARQYFIQLEKDWNSPEKVMARALQIANKKLQVLEAQAEENRPKVLFADSVAASHTSILIFDLAKILKQNGVEIGGHRLFDWMRKNGYLVRRDGNDHNMPTQRSMEMGLFEVKETTVSHSDGHISVNKNAESHG